MNSNAKYVQCLFVFLLFVFMSGCSAEDTPQSEPSATIEPTLTPVPTASSVPTDTPVPVTFTWVQKSDIPTPRCRHAVSVMDGKIYLIGGSGDALTKVEMYDPVTNTWIAKADMPTGRLWLSTSVLDGKIYAIGGVASYDGPVLATVEMYDPATDIWSTKAEMPGPRYALGTVALDGKIYAIGGIVLTDEGEFIRTARVEVYDPATDTWTPGKDMLIAKEAKTVVINGKIYATNGGANEVYDPSNNRWSAIANFPGKVVSKTVSELDGRLYTFGGGSASVPQAVVFMYDPVSDVWEQLSDMPFSRWEMAASQVNGKIYLFGGVEQEFGESLRNPQPLSSVWEITIEP